ncbi:hypothetical protein L9F63_024827, partial [Diploptera punctata]
RSTAMLTRVHRVNLSLQIVASRRIMFKALGVLRLTEMLRLIGGAASKEAKRPVS